MPKLLIATLGFISTAGYASLAMLFPAIPAISRSLIVELTTAQWLISSGFFTMGLGHLLFGMMADRICPRLLATAAMLSFALASLAAGCADDIGLMIAARVAQTGAASAAILVARVIALDSMDRDHAASQLTYIILPVTFIPLFVPLLSGMLIDHLSWRWIFYVCGLLGLVGAALAWRVIPRRASPLPNSLPNSLPKIAAFDWSGMVKLLRAPDFVGYTGHHGFVVGASQLLQTAGPIIVIQQLHASATDYGLYSMLPAVGSIAGAMLGANIARRVGGDRLIEAGATLAVTAYAAIALTSATDNLTLLSLFLPWILVSFSGTLSLPSSSAGSLQRHPQLRGTGSGLSGLLQWLGAGFAVQLVVPWLEHSTTLVLGITLTCYLAAVACFLYGRRHLQLMQQPV